MGIFSAILSPALFGVTNFIDKFILEKHNLHPVVITVYGGIFAFIVGLIILLFAGVSGINARSAIIIVASGITTSLYLLPYFKALKLDDTSRVVPLFQVVPIFVLILSFLFLGEKLLIKQYAGSLIIVIASFLLTIEKPESRMFQFRPAFWYMMLSSFLVSVSIVLYKFGVENISFFQSLSFEGFGMMIGSICILLYGKNFAVVKKQLKLFNGKLFMAMLSNEFIYMLARYTLNFALTVVPAGIASVLGGLQPLFVLIYGVLLSLFFPSVIKEVISPKVVGLKLISIVIIFAGLYLIFL